MPYFIPQAMTQSAMRVGEDTLRGRNHQSIEQARN